MGENGRKMAKVVTVNKNAHINALCSVHIATGLRRIKSMFFNNAGMFTSEMYKWKKTGLQLLQSEPRNILYHLQMELSVRQNQPDH